LFFQHAPELIFLARPWRWNCTLITYSPAALQMRSALENEKRVLVCWFFPIRSASGERDRLRPARKKTFLPISDYLSDTCSSSNNNCQLVICMQLAGLASGAELFHNFAPAALLLNAELLKSHEQLAGRQRANDASSRRRTRAGQRNLIAQPKCCCAGAFHTLAISVAFLNITLHPLTLRQYKRVSIKDI
jgi:hypothetical protein